MRSRDKVNQVKTRLCVKVAASELIKSMELGEEILCMTALLHQFLFHGISEANVDLFFEQQKYTGRKLGDFKGRCAGVATMKNVKLCFCQVFLNSVQMQPGSVIVADGGKMTTAAEGSSARRPQ